MKGGCGKMSMGLLGGEEQQFCSWHGLCRVPRATYVKGDQTFLFPRSLIRRFDTADLRGGQCTAQCTCIQAALKIIITLYNSQ